MSDLPNKLITSAPGKMLLIGGYAVLKQGNPGYVVGIDKRGYANFRETEDSITIKLPQFKAEVRGDFNGKDILCSSQITERQKEKTKFVKNAASLSLRYLGEIGVDARSFEITTANDPAFTYQWGESKSGLGSSSAITAATVAGVFEFHGLPINDHKDEIHKLAQMAHYLSQKKVGSGFDIALTVFGSIIYERYNPDILSGNFDEEIKPVLDNDWGHTATSVSFPSNLHIAIAFTGKSASTKEFIRKISLYEDEYPEEYNELMEELNAENIKTINHLQKLSTNWDEELLEPFTDNFQYGWSLTAQLGYNAHAKIETPKFRRMIEKANRSGALCSKLPGAGGGDSIVAICKNIDDKKRVMNTWRNLGIQPYEQMDVDDRTGVSVTPEEEFRKILTLI